MSTFEIAIQTIGTVFASSAVGSVVGSVATQAWTRRSAKKAPKTQERAKAYEQMLEHLCGAVQGGRIRYLPECSAALCSLSSKVVLYGESEVVREVSAVVDAYRSSPNGIPANELLRVVKAMRSSLLTGTSEETMHAVERLLAPQSDAKPTTA